MGAMTPIIIFTMSQKNLPTLLTLFFIVFITSISVHGLSLEEVEDIVDDASFSTVSISAFGVSNGKLDINLTRGEIRVELYGVNDNLTSLNYIYLNPNDDHDTSAVTFEDIDVEYATIYLKKNIEHMPIKGVMHSDNGINFTILKDYEFFQNESYVWFTVSHFSSWTASIDSPIEIIDGDDLTIDVDDFATIDATDYVCVRYVDPDVTPYTTQELCAPSGSSGFNDDTVSSTFEIYYIQVASDNTIYIDTSDKIYGQTWDDEDFAVLIRNSDGSLDIGDLGIGLLIRDYEEPEIFTYSANSITDTGATLRGEPFFNDHTGSITGTFRYREVGAGSWSYTSFVSVSDDSVYTATLSGLSPGTEYEYEAQISFTSENGGGSLEYEGDTETFTTTDSSQPQVSTVSAITGDGFAYFRALADFNGYSGGDVNLFWKYRKVGDATWINAPSSGYENPTDGVVFTSSQESGLTNGDEYEFYALLLWDSNTESDIGEILTFTPSAPSSGSSEGADLNDGAIAYYKFQDSDFPYIDEVNSYNFVSGNDKAQVTGVIDSAQTLDGQISTNAYEDFELTEPIFSLWLYLDSDVLGTFLSTYDSSGSNGVTCYYNNGDNNIICNLWDGGSYDSAKTSVNSLPLDLWTHFALYYNSTSGDMKLYIDGSEDTTETVEGITSIGYPSGTSTDLQIGERDGGTAPYDGVIDELYVGDASQFSRSSIDEIVSYLYASGSPDSDQQYPFPEGSPVPEPEVNVLNPSSVTFNSALLRGIGFFNASVYTLYPGFNWRENGTSTWSNYTGVNPVSDNSTYSYAISSLDYGTVYEIQAYLENSSGYHWFSNTTTFTTSIPETPNATISAPSGVSSSEALIKGIVTYEGYSSVNYYFQWRESGIGSNFTNTDVINYPGGGGTLSVSYQLENLSESTEYQYKLNIDYGDGFSETVDSDIYTFSTSEFGAPVITTGDNSRVLRTTATIDGNISDLGTYESVNVYFNYGIFNETTLQMDDTNYTTTQYTVSSPQELQANLTGLNINQTYGYELVVEYGIDSVLSGGVDYFITLSLDDFIPPIINSISAPIINYNNAMVSANIDLTDSNTSSLLFELYENGASVNDSGYITVTTNGSTTFEFTNLESDTTYTLQAVLFYYDPDSNSTKSVFSDEYDFTTLNIISVGKEVSVTPSFSFYVSDPYFFQMLLIVGTTIVGIGLSVGSKFSNGDTAVEKFLIYGIFMTSIAILIWGSSQLIISPTQIIFTFLTVALFSIYWLLDLNRGAVYG